MHNQSLLVAATRQATASTTFLVKGSLQGGSLRFPDITASAVENS